MKSAKEIAEQIWMENPCFATVGSAELFYEYISPVIAAALAEKDEHVAELEQQVRVLENPRVTDWDWHKMALMYQERVEELEADRDVYKDPGWIKKLTAAARIEGLREAYDIIYRAVTWKGGMSDVQKRIVKLEKND